MRQYSHIFATENKNNMKKYIGNVICDVGLKLDIGLKKCTTMTECEPFLPILIVGLENARKNIIDFNILEKKAKKQADVWWTYKRNERLSDYREDMEAFFNHCLTKITEKVSYELLDVVKMNVSDVKEALRMINSDNFKYVYNDRDCFIFIYCPEKLKIFGLSLTTCAFLGIVPKKIVDKVKSNTKNVFIKDFTKISSRIKKILGDKLHNFIIIYDYFGF